jgi:hypothetical protein
MGGLLIAAGRFSNDNIIGANWRLEVGWDWMVRGRCNFEEKLRRLFSGHATAVVMFDEIGGR